MRGSRDEEQVAAVDLTGRHGADLGQHHLGTGVDHACGDSSGERLGVAEHRLEHDHDLHGGRLSTWFAHRALRCLQRRRARGTVTGSFGTWGGGHSPLGRTGAVRRLETCRSRSTTPAPSNGSTPRSAGASSAVTVWDGSASWARSTSRSCRRRYDAERGTAYFRAGTFGEIARRVHGQAVSLQVDDLDRRTFSGWSVVMTGTAHRVDDAATVAARWSVGRPSPWLPSPDSQWIALQVDDIHGERVRRECLHLSVVRRLRGRRPRVAPSSAGGRPDLTGR